MVNLKALDTEQRNARTSHIDELGTLEMLTLINEEDQRVALAVKAVLPEIVQAVDVIYDRLHTGGRLVYCGAGTSGRLGVLDAVECPPTYGVSPDLVVGLIAGDPSAFVKAAEGAEDKPEAGADDLRQISFGAGDVLAGIAHTAAAELAALVCAVFGRLSRTEGELVLSGSILSHYPAIAQEMLSLCAERLPGVRPVPMRGTAAQGAARLALREAGLAR